MSDVPLMSARELVKHFALRPKGFGGFFGDADTVKAVNGFSIDIARGETVGLVGESGSGKSTIGRLLARLLEPTSGSIDFEGEPWLEVSGEALRRRRASIQMVFQNPFLSLDPRWSVRDIVAEPLRTHHIVPEHQIRDTVVSLLESVGLTAAHMDRYPHQFSGGQRQRIGIARAIAPEPQMLIADEPVSALDVSVQAQVLALLRRIRTQRGFAMLFISHDLSVVRYISDRVGVLYLGTLVEIGPTRQVFERPFHPYTAALLSAVPEPTTRRTRSRIMLKGEPPSVTALPAGCVFAARCPVSEARCHAERPTLKNQAPNRDVACHFPERASRLLAGEKLTPA